MSAATIPTRSSSAHDLRCCRQVLGGAHPAGKLLEIRYSADHGVMREMFVAAGRLDLAVDAIGSLAEHTDVYTGVLLCTPRGGRDAVLDSQLVFVGIHQVDAEQRLDAAGHQPTMVVCSETPGHIHAYFALAHEIDTDAVERANRPLAYALGGDLRSVDRAPHSPPGVRNASDRGRSLACLLACGRVGECRGGRR